MFILQSLQEFVNNPMGKGSNAISSRQLIKDDLHRRFTSLLTEKKKKITFTLYKNKTDYFFHFLIPSESTERQNTYDVVLQFTPGEDAAKANDKNLNRYDVKFFSNSPSFTYTYAYAFNLYGMFVEGLENKYRDDVFTKPPVTRNPGEIVNYEKTIYFAAQYLLDDSKYLNKLIIDTLAKPYKENEFNKKIRNSDAIEVEIRTETNRVKRKTQDKEKEKQNSPGTPGRRGNTVSSKGPVAGRPTAKRTTAKSKTTPKKSTITKIKPR